MGPDEMFGELSLLDGGARSATVTAVTRAELVAIEREPFLRLFESRPSVAIALMEVVARRLRRLSERSEDVAGLPVASRLAKQLFCWPRATLSGRSDPRAAGHAALPARAGRAGGRVPRKRE